MLPYIYLILSVLTISTSSIFGTYYNRKNEGARDPSALYNFLQAASVCVCWVILYLLDFSFEAAVLPYSVLFGICFAVCNIGIICALQTGPTSLTTLFVALSLILTTVWGFFFWDAPFTLIVFIGLVLVVASIVLCLTTGKKEEKKLSFKWLVFVLMACFGNAGCSIVQRTQQTDFDGAHGKMLMAFATLFATAVCFVLYLRSDKRDTKAVARRSWYFPVLAGVCNVVLNLCVMLLALTTLPPSLVYPVIGVGELAIVMLFSLFAFRERLRWWQWLGILLGAVATVLLSI